MSPQRSLLLLVVVLAAVLGPLTLGTHVPGQHDIVAHDLFHSTLQYRVFQGSELAQGRFPLWMPGVFSGVPLAGQIEAGVYYVPNLVLYALFSPTRALDLSILLHTLLGGIGAWVLARALGVQPLPAVFAGLAYGACGFQVAHLKHPNIHAAAAWFPWAWAALEHARAGWRPGWPLLGLAFGIQALAGHPQITWLSGVTLGLIGLGYAASERRLEWRWIVALIAGGLLAAIAILPGWFLSKETARAGGADFEFATRFHFHPSDLLFFVVPKLRGSPFDCTWWPADDATLPWEDYAYVGLVPVFLALYAAVRLVNERRVQQAAALAGIAMFFVLSTWTPLYYVLWKVVPGLSLFRFPTRALFLVDLGIALLAAFGAQHLLQQLREEGSGNVTLIAVGAVLMTGVDLGLNHSPHILYRPASSWAGPHAALEAVRGDDVRPRVYTLDPFEVWAKASEQACTDPAVFDGLTGIPVANSPVQHGIATADGYLVLTPRRAQALWSPVDAPGVPPIDLPDGSDPRIDRLRRARVTHLYSRDALELSVLATDGDFTVYRVPDVVPEAYVSPEWVQAEDLEEAALYIDEPGVVPVVEGEVQPSGEGDLVAATVTRSTDTIRVQLPATEGLLVVADSWARGWQAHVDGHYTPLHVANGYQLAVFVDADDSEVVFTYTPPGIGGGRMLSALALVGLLGWLAFSLAAPPRGSRGDGGTRPARGPSSASPAPTEPREATDSPGPPPPPAAD